MRCVAIRAVRVMGHASIVITQRYTDLAPHVSQDAVRLLDPPTAPTSERPAKNRGTPGASGAQSRAPWQKRRRSRYVSEIVDPMPGTRLEAQRG
jgi:hypothetical protein